MTARAENVGSLLRPPRLRAALAEVYGEGQRALLPEVRARDIEGLRAVEDDCIREALARQRDAGLAVVTDGEFRRYMFQNSFWDALEGYTTDRNPVTFRDATGDTVTWHVHRIEERLRVVDSPAAREAAFLAAESTLPFKVTFPAASLFTHPFTFTPAGAGGYRDLDELVAHAIEIERGLVADAIAAGCRYIQFDFALYPYLCDPGWRAAFERDGHDVDAVLDRAIAADRAVLEGIPAGVTTAIHVCRGNYRSHWLCEGSLEPVAERMFGEVPVDAWLVEWDDTERDGGYEPIRFVRPGATMVPGLLSSKRPEVEEMAGVLRRLEQASRLLPYEQLAISTQCGFASVMEGNSTDQDAQWAKLELVGRVADRVWG